jgi:hypothetical protein
MRGATASHGIVDVKNILPGNPIAPTIGPIEEMTSFLAAVR